MKSVMKYIAAVACSLLVRVVNKLSADASLRKDLIQEALIQLWRLQSQCPGQHSSWYLQGCQFHLQNYLRRGRSIDSWKRRHKQLRVLATDSDDSSEQGNLTEPLSRTNSGEAILSVVCARDLMALLSKWLDPLDRLILEQLADGLSVREVGARLNLSHTSVVNRRRKIAAFALKLGCLPAPNPRAATFRNSRQPKATLRPARDRAADGHRKILLSTRGGKTLVRRAPELTAVKDPSVTESLG